MSNSIRAFFAALGWAYPVAWIAASILFLSPLGTQGISRPSTMLWAQAGLSALLMASLVRGPRVAGWIAAIASAAPLVFWTIFASSRRGGWMAWAGVALSVFVLIPALRRVKLSWPVAALVLAPAFLLPFAIFTREYPASRFAVFAGILAAGLVLSRIRNGAEPLPAIPWSGVIAGFAATAIFAGATWWLPIRREEVRSQENRKLLASILPVRAETGYPRHFFQRGVSFTAESGVRYDSPDARAMLEKLPDWGVDSIALIPFGFTRQNPLRIQPGGRRSWENEEGIEILAALAHSKGMRVMLKPHVWRPAMDQVDTPEHRAIWFEQYTGFIEHYARLATRIHADLFCIGTELAAVSKYEAEWRVIIARIREIYPGPLTYAANHGPEFETLAFWDELDYIGIDNYYPLPDDYSTQAMAAKIRTVHAKFKKPVLFTEAGFSAVENAHRAPWEDRTEKPLSLDEQARCYEALLTSFYREPWFSGVYWWKVGTNGYGGPNDNTMTPWGKPAMSVVKRFYAGAPRQAD